MANIKKEKEFLDTEEFAKIVAERASFSQADVREILTTMKEVFEECITEGVDIDIRGFIHMRIVDIEFKTIPGIVKFHGGNEGYNRKSKKIIFSTPLNFKKLLRKPKETIILEGAKENDKLV